MSIDSISLIQGMSLGLEFVDAMPEEDFGNSVIFDCFFVRFIFLIG